MISDAHVTATCDECLYSEEVELTALARSGEYDMRYVSATLERDGWQVGDGDHLLCEACKEEAEEADGS